MKYTKQKILKYYYTRTEKSPFLEWLNDIKDKKICSRILRRIDLLESGHYGDCKALGSGVYELRLSFGPGYRIYFSEVDSVVILILSAGDKSSQIKDISRAKLFWREMQERQTNA